MNISLGFIIKLVIYELNTIIFHSIKEVRTQNTKLKPKSIILYIILYDSQLTIFICEVVNYKNILSGYDFN